MGHKSRMGILGFMGCTGEDLHNLPDSGGSVGPRFRILVVRGYISYFRGLPSSYRKKTRFRCADDSHADMQCSGRSVLPVRVRMAHFHRDSDQVVVSVTDFRVDLKSKTRALW